jgi:hypothetical protein
MHSSERHSQSVPFCEYVFAPGKSPVEVQHETLEIILFRKVYVVYIDWWTGFSSCRECDTDRLGFVRF